MVDLVGSQSSTIVTNYFLNGWTYTLNLHNYLSDMLLRGGN